MSEQQDTTEAPATTPEPLRAERPERGTKWIVHRGGLSERVDRLDGKDVRRAAKALNAAEADVRAAIDAAAEMPAAAVQEPEVPVKVIGNDGGKPDGKLEQEYPDLDTALAQSPHEFLRWDGTRRLAALDVDVLDGRPYPPGELDGYVRLAAPSPTWAWPTRSGGLRLIFEPCERFGLNAAERAGMYAILVPEVSHHERTDRVELIARTRHPPKGERVLRPGGGYGVSDITGALMRRGGADAVPQELIDRWLDERAMVRGQRYDHMLCVIDPGPHGARDPVSVRDDGVFCFRCAGTGNGWRPWAALVSVDSARKPAEVDPLVAQALYFVHWTHARLLLLSARPRVPEWVLRAGYRALLRVVHDAKWEEIARERAAGVWRDDLRIVRGRGAWLHAHDYTLHDSVKLPTLRVLPWVGGSGPQCDRAATTSRLEGFVPIEPVAHVVTSPTWVGDAVLVPRPIGGEEPGCFLDLKDSRAALLSAMPGASESWVDLVYLLVLAGVRAQLRLSPPPMVVVTGPTGAGKGAALAAAEGILASPHHEIGFNGPRELAASVGAGLEKGSALLLGDEIGKVSEFWAQSKVLLDLRDTHTWRKLYVGAVSAPMHAAIVLMGSTLPRGLTTMSEMARRAVLWTLPRVDRGVSARWESQACAALGVQGLQNLRESPMGAAIAEAFIERARADLRASEVLAGACLPVPWVEQARSVGASWMGEDEDACDLTEIVQRLYRLWCDGPDDIRIPDKQRHAGWLRCWRTGKGDAAAEALGDWVDDEDTLAERMGRLGRLETADVVDACGLPHEVRLVVRAHGRRIAVRFVAPGFEVPRKSIKRRDPEAFPPAAIAAELEPPICQPNCQN
ncbi:MAG TPA: hypothetical protein VEA38_22990 [Terriglobales bacterium]|nr:hypothetical protein [Terriglobales bacterium]